MTTSKKKKSKPCSPLKWQKPHIESLIKALSAHPYVLDASDTGTGKTFTALFVAKHFKKPLYVIAPKSVIPSWEEASRMVDYPLSGCINVEKLRTGRYEEFTRLGKGRFGTSYKCNLDPSTLVIIDEAHKLGGVSTFNSRLLRSIVLQRVPALLLSATVADSPLKLSEIGWIFGLHKGGNNFYSWAKAHGCYQNPFSKSPQSLCFNPKSRTGKAGLLKIQKILFPERGARMRIANIPDFPENAIITQLVTINRRRLFEPMMEEETLKILLRERDRRAEQKKAQPDIPDEDLYVTPEVVFIQAERRVVEMSKLTIFHERARDAVESGKNVAIFLNFKASVYELQKKLKKSFASFESVVITADESKDDRKAALERFQSNEVHILIATIGAGGTGVSLHDLHGRPRESIISPPESAVELKQALGRIHRAESKSKAIQYILFAGDTYEETTYERVKNKLQNISAINDGTLSLSDEFQENITPTKGE